MDERMNPNQHFAELAGICWHEPIFTSIGTDPVEIKHRCIKCHKIVGFQNPDFAAEPWRVLEVMESDQGFIGSIAATLKVAPQGCEYSVSADYIKDRTGKLRDAAIEWMEGRKKK